MLGQGQQTQTRRTMIAVDTAAGKSAFWLDELTTIEDKDNGAFVNLTPFYSDQPRWIDSTQTTEQILKIIKDHSF